MAEGIVAVLVRNLTRALGSGDLSQAALILERLKHEDPLSVTTRGLELEYLLREGKLREARTLGEQLLQLFPRSPRIHYLAGQVAYQTREYRAAVEHFRESHRIRNHWRSSLAWAKALTQLGELDEAASIFDSLLPEHPECYRELAWLYERQEDFGRALNAIDEYLRRYPDNEAALAQRLRLRARAMDPAELVSETRELLEYGDEPDDSLLPQYVEALFRTGQVAEVREFVGQRRAQLSSRSAAGTAWVCYRFQAYDLALDLFLIVFAGSHSNAKFLSALEFAAGRCGRLAELIRVYESHAPEARHLFGRLRNLRRRADRRTGGWE